MIKLNWRWIDSLIILVILQHTNMSSRLYLSSLKMSSRLFIKCLINICLIIDSLNTIQTVYKIVCQQCQLLSLLFWIWLDLSNNIYLLVLFLATLNKFSNVLHEYLIWGTCLRNDDILHHSNHVTIFQWKTL